ncbi:hypothetical protein B0A48_05085 [Cryoendolithus antarcticus]|uniref:Uncharacterized protein n=1 Tax=Cryoendolithus antarcticus TaxID=1507870 RepID=A0A1V8TE80_9PEZI|nr:hypothetical protein B0A48_05085 [Cryoendolithus antarcticus]
MSLCTGTSSCIASRHFGSFAAGCVGDASNSSSRSSSRSSSSANGFRRVAWSCSLESTTARRGSAWDSLPTSPRSTNRTSDFGSLTSEQQRLFDGFEWARHSSIGSIGSDVVGWCPGPAGSAGSSTSLGWVTVDSVSEHSTGYLTSDRMFGPTMAGAEADETGNSPPASLLFESRSGPARFARNFSDRSSVEVYEGFGLREEEGEAPASAGVSTASSRSSYASTRSSQPASSRRLSDYGLGSPFIGWGSPAVQPSSESASEAESEPATAGSAPERTTAQERAAESGWAGTGELGTGLPRRLTV